MNICLFTMVLARHELDQIEQWLSYHAKSGIRRFRIAIDREKVVDRAFGERGENAEWKKKPGANFHLEMSYPEVLAEFRSRVEKCADLFGLDVELFDVPKRFWRISDVGIRQAHVATYLVRGRGDSSLPKLTDWLAFIDVDEFLVFDERWLARRPEDVGVIEFKQRVFQSRWNKRKEARDVSLITTRYLGRVPVVKTMVRPEKLIRWTHVHRVRKNHTRGRKIYAPEKKLRYHHFLVPAEAEGAETAKEFRQLAAPTVGVGVRRWLTGEAVCDSSHTSDVGVIISTPRAGSSLFCHLMAEAKMGNVAGETHIPWRNEAAVQDVKKRIRNNVNWLDERLLYLDKIVTVNCWRNNVPWIVQRSSRVYIHVRHPFGVLYSLSKTPWRDWNEVNLVALYEKRLHGLRQFVRLGRPQRTFWSTYYQLTDPNVNRQLVGEPLRCYEKLPTTGRPGWGDTSKAGGLILKGEVVRVGLEHDLVKRDRLESFGIDPEELDRLDSEYFHLLERIKRRFKNMFEYADEARFVRTPLLVANGDRDLSLS